MSQTPTLTAEMLLPDGQMARIDADVLDIVRRVREGDELWRGDPTMDVGWNFVMERFEVWGIDAEGTPYLAATAERLDHRILQKLTENDWQRGKSAVIANALAARAHRKAMEDTAAERSAEHVDALGWAIRKDLGRTAMEEVTALLQESIQYALDHREEALDYALRFGRDLDRGQADAFVGMYVNDWTLDFGERGR